MASPVERVADANVLAIGAQPSAAMTMAYSALAASIAIALQNAVSTQRAGQVLTSASTATICALIVSKAS